MTPTQQQIKQARKDSGLSQVALARFLGVHERTIQNWEAGLTRCPHAAWILMKTA